MNKISLFFKKILKYCVLSKTESLILGIVFFSYLMIFVGGSFNTKTKVEQIANEISETVRNNGRAGLLCSSETENILTAERFSKYVNDQFYEIAPFKSVIGYNFDKTVDCRIEEFGELGSNMSLLTSTYFTNHIDSGKNIFDRYYLELLFKETNTSRGAGIDNLIYITKSQADLLIQINHLDSYQSVLNTNIEILVDGISQATWKIANIIDDECMFAQIAESTFGNYALCYTLVPQQLKNSASMLLLMSDSTYSNIDFISLIESSFSKDKYVFKSFGEIENKKMDHLIDYLNNRSGNELLNTLSILIIALFFIPFIGLAFFYIRRNVTIKNLIYFIVCSLLFWLILFTVYKISHSTLMFSFISLSVFFIILMSFSLLMFIVWLVKNYGKRNTII